MSLGVFGYDVGIGTFDEGTRAVQADPRRSYVASGPIASGLSADWERDDILPDREGRLRRDVRWHGIAEYEAMYNTPAASSCVNAIRFGVLSGGIGLLPAIKPRLGMARPGQEDGTAVEAEMASRIAESNGRTLAAWDTPADLVVFEMMESLWLGHVLAEVEAGDVAGGPDDGLIAVTGLRTLPRRNYRFLLDKAGKVARIGAAAIGGGWQEFDTDHFAWLTWDPHRGDPRGRSCFRMAHYHWRMLMDLWPEVYKGWKQFGVPLHYGTTAPGARMEPERDPATGLPKQGGKSVTPEHAMVLAMMRLVNGSRAAGPNGSDIKVVESTKDSSVVSGAVSILEAQIKQSIILAIRATTEAEHGSKADSGTAQDVMGTLIRFVRKWVERFLRSVLIRQNTWNYGPEIARRLTPLVTLGDHEHQDFASNSAGVGLLYQAGYFAASQLPYVDTFLGLPQRQPDDVRVGPNGVISDTPAPDPNAPPAPTPPDAAPAGKAAA